MLTIKRRQPGAPTSMKLLVFAHTPPPHHGQELTMVHLMLEGLGGDQRKRRRGGPAAPPVECYHVNARVSKRSKTSANSGWANFCCCWGHCLQAIWCRFRYGVENFYLCAGAGQALGGCTAIGCDVCVAGPFFKRLILHWHAAGLAKWLETAVQIRSRSFTYRALKDADLCVVLSHYNRQDAEKLWPRQIKW